MANQTETVAPKKTPWLKRIAISLFFLFVLMQFIQPEKNNQSMDMSRDISQVVAVPDSVQKILRTACYDCHSNYTVYPWYTNIQPGGWWMKRHVDEGKENINFQEFAAYQPKGKYKTTQEVQKHKLEEVIESIQEGFMPLESYTWIHKDAILSEAQKKVLINWAEKAITEIK